MRVSYRLPGITWHVTYTWFGPVWSYTLPRPRPRLELLQGGKRA